MMSAKSTIESFIEFARHDASVREKLADCAIDSWDSTHLPLDIDIKKVIAVASTYGYNITISEIIATQCQKLSEFWRFEMENAFVARRAMSMIQYQMTSQDPALDYYSL